MQATSVSFSDFLPCLTRKTALHLLNQVHEAGLNAQSVWLTAPSPENIINSTKSPLSSSSVIASRLGLGNIVARLLPTIQASGVLKTPGTSTPTLHGAGS